VWKMGDARSNRIDDAVSKAGELIGALQQHGEITPGQARVIVESVVRAEVPNFEAWEIRDSAQRIVGELEGEGERRGNHITG
jgi:hypothetical protein